MISNEKIKNLVEQYQSVKNEGDKYHAFWKKIANNVDQQNPILKGLGAFQDQNISSFTATILRQLSSVIISQMVNTDARPIKLKPKNGVNEAIKDLQINFKDYIQTGIINENTQNSNLQEAMRSIENGVYSILQDYDYNFHEAFKACMEDFLLFGNSAIEIVIGKDDFSDFSFKRISPDKVYFTENRLGRIDKIFKNVEYTISQIKSIDGFDLSKIDEIKDAENNLSKKIKFLEIIEKNPKFEYISYSKRNQMLKQNEQISQEKGYNSYLIYKNEHCVLKSGYNFMPIIFARYKKEDGLYSSSIVGNILPAIIHLNEIDIAIAKYGILTSDPPKFLKSGGLMDSPSFTPGEIIGVNDDVIDPSQILTKAYNAEIDLQNLLGYRQAIQSEISENLMYSEVMRGQVKDGNPATAFEIKSKTMIGMQQIASVYLSCQKLFSIEI